MRQQLNTFDKVAPVYDRLSQAVFGRSMFDAQTLFLSAISPYAKVLILGGGTGWLLAELTKRNPSCSIWYIDASSKMLELSKTKIAEAGNPVYFIHGIEDSIPTDVTFDAVITHFYLDLFPSALGNHVIQKIKSAIHPKSVWIVSDFMNETWWQRIMLKVMYNFFGITCNLQAVRLPGWRQQLTENGFVEDKHDDFYGKFIRSSIFVLK